MATQTLVWTALPNGFDQDGNLRISALVAPRLVPDADQILKPFGDFLDWPAAIRSATFTIGYGTPGPTILGSETVGANRIDDSLDVADTATWMALFNPETPVEGYVFKDLTTAAVLSYDTVTVDALAQVLYGSLASSTGASLPTISDIFGNPAWQSLITAVATIDRTFTDERTGRRDTQRQFEQFIQNGALKFRDPIASVLAQAQLFHTPPAKPAPQDYQTAGLAADDPRLTSKTTWPSHAKTALPAKIDFQKIIDFHRIVTAMGAYPRLLRRLGLVVDFIVERGTFTNAADKLLSVDCVLGTPADGVDRTSMSNRTHARLSDSRFTTVPKAAPAADDLRVVDGLLNIAPNQFAVLQSDVDAVGLKLMNFARTLGRLVGDVDKQADPVTKFEKEAGAPALRNAGLMLVQRRRASMLKSAFDGAKQKNTALQAAIATPAASKPPELWAEDLVRGWRVDVWDDRSTRWRSLCERTARYRLPDIELEDDSEGMLRLAATQSADGNNPKLVYLHEALLSWTGWSLVAPQPGRIVGIEKDADGRDRVADQTTEVPPGLPMTSEFVVKAGSLPRLRYGRSYRLRARATDLAGNSLGPRSTDFGPAQPTTPGVKYLRFEPLLPPSLALIRDGADIEKPDEGETMDRIAIRTFNDTPADNIVPTADVARRLAVEARSTVREAELHGSFDDGGHVNGSAAVYALITGKDSPLEEAKLDTPGPLAGSDPVTMSYAVLDGSATEIPYLPDPLCVEMTARLIDHPSFSPDDSIPIPAYAAGAQWPNASPFVIRVVEDAAGTPRFADDTRVLEIPLPKAARVKLLLACRLFEPSTMGVWNWLPAASRPAVAEAAREGRHWALTPWRVVELVHAVQRPLIAPVMKLFVVRWSGATFVEPRFTATCSIASTARVDLQAEWNEPDGDRLPAGGANRAKVDHAFSVKITDPQTYASRDQHPGALGTAEHLTLSENVISVGDNRDLAAHKFHEFHDTRYRRIEYWLEATTRFREYMPASLLTIPSADGPVETDEHIKVVGPRFVTWVPNSAPPPAPDVLYVMPTFGWTRTTDAQGTTRRTRRGGGLRIYLNRPWNASGYGEMLGVVLPRAGFAGDPNDSPAGKPYKKFVTQWGADPIWESASVSGVSPKASHFPRARLNGDPSGAWLPSFAPAIEADQPPGPFTTTGLLHPGLVFNDLQATVDVAPHDVLYDEVRQLWYCDIEINFGLSYFPFVRLAVARYQPVSVSGAALSEIVPVDFISLAPDRWLTVSKSANDASRTVTVFGHGYSESSGHAEVAKIVGPFESTNTPAAVSSTSVVEVWVERLHPERGEDFGWLREPGAVVTRATDSTLPPFVITPPPPIVVRPNPNPVIVRPPVTPGRGSLQPQIRPDIVRPSPDPTIFTEGPIDFTPGLFSPVIWEGTVTLGPNSPPDARYRIVVAEYEEYLVDDETPYDAIPTAKGRRVVFVEHVEM